MKSSEEGIYTLPRLSFMLGNPLTRVISQAGRDPDSNDPLNLQSTKSNVFLLPRTRTTDALKLAFHAWHSRALVLPNQSPIIATTAADSRISSISVNSPTELRNPSKQLSKLHRMNPAPLHAQERLPLVDLYPLPDTSE